MLRDMKFTRRNHNKIPQSEGSNENLHPLDPSSTQNLEFDPNRPPLNLIQEPIRNPRLVPDRKAERTPIKNQTQFRTPEKTAGFKNRFGWAPEYSEVQSQLPPLSRCGFTPRGYRVAGKASSVQSDCGSVQSTPTKSVSKPISSGFGSSSSRNLYGGTRTMNFSVASKGMPMSAVTPIAYVAAEVSHFELREDPSFWMDHNVQAVIRVRPLNSSEKTSQGYNRCLKQESAQSITWLGQPETRFTFDYVACETISQELLFRVAGLPMVENCMSGYNSCMFAYGQTGSGKTYTMLGEIGESDLWPSADRGMTPRIFEFLFARIKAEEESRIDENLKYNCKCSFLEIYNEQITDLLDPSSTNLLLREDLQKGVYVENLTEFEVETVNDILKLLFQGAANRKVAATNMNRESSRSHCVFTCAIESKWGKDATTNLRFARLNLVDLAGSERQKTSGAEGERLKEAANINKSLSTLGHVIMILADVAQGKQRHIPYRDSKLTFLLQDSLGGNSKTMIIANVSPSICSASETLSTLKFAQRARLIQNNAVVNEDASGDVNALQHQICLLKDELSLLKRQNVSRSLLFRAAIIGDATDDHCDASVIENLHGSAQMSVDELYNGEDLDGVQVSTKQLKTLEATLAGALRREKVADTTIKQLEAEIEQLNRLVRQREEDTRCSKMMLKFREDKISRMAALLDGKLPPDSYLVEENNAKSEEIELIRVKADRNPEVTRFALENIRLLDQLKRFQDFYEEGERELLLTEVSELRNQLLLNLDGKSELDHHAIPDSDSKSQEDACTQSTGSVIDNKSLYIKFRKTSEELEDCRNKLNACLENNARLTREMSNLHDKLHNIKSANNYEHIDVEPEDMELCLDSPQSSPVPYLANHTEEMLNLQLELDILKTILGEEKSARIEIENRAFSVENELKASKERILQHQVIQNELKDARSIIEALESQQILSLNELEEMRESNNHNVNLLKKQDEEIAILKKHIDNFDIVEKLPSACKMLKDASLKFNQNEESPLQEKLKRMQASLEKARSLNTRFQSDQASIEEEKEEVRRQVEVETSEVIVCLQEELINLQQQVDESNRNELEARQSLMTLETELAGMTERLSFVIQENKELGDQLGEKERDLKLLSEKWQRFAFEIAEALADGNVALEDAFDQVTSISDTFSDSSWVSEQIEKITRSNSEKDLMIEELQKCLENAEIVKCDMEWKLRSLRGATLAITEAQQQESYDKEREIMQLTSELSEKAFSISELQNRVKLGEERLRVAGISATVAFITVNQLYEGNAANTQALEHVKTEFETQVEALKAQLVQSEEKIHNLLSKQEQSQEIVQIEHDQVMEHQAKEEHDSYFPGDLLSEERMKLNELKVGVSTLNSYVNEYTEQLNCPTEEYIEIADYKPEHRAEIELNEFRNVEHRCRHFATDSMNNIEHKNKLKNELLSDDTLHRETAIVLLRKELESALVSLKGVQNQMAKLLDEKEADKKSEDQSKKDIEVLTNEVLRLKSEIADKEQQFDLRLLELEEKLQGAEGTMMQSKLSWQNTKEGLELEISNAKIIATQKTIEASNLLLKVEEVQETMRDADVMVNALMEANETAKTELQRHKKIECALDHEKTHLISKVQMLQSSLDMKDLEYESKEKNYLANLAEARGLLLALEDAFGLLQSTFTEKFKLIEFNFDGLKSQLNHHTQLARAWLEEIWAEIIGKDCAVSVLHLCHMGILLERVTGLNVENGFLYRGLCESNSVVSDLKEHNFMAKKELELCSILKGKLLIDINNSFNRITKKEYETLELKARLNSFEEKIMRLQLQEESMLDRSNSIGTELAILMKELDSSNRNAFLAISAQEKLERENEELSYQLEKMKEEFILNKIGLEVRNNEINFVVVEIENLKIELVKVKDESFRVAADLEEANVRVSSTIKHANIIDEENHKLQGRIRSSETCITRLQVEMDKKCAQLELMSKELVVKNEVNEGQIKTTHAIETENVYLKNELLEFNRNNCYDLAQFVDTSMKRVFEITNSQLVLQKDKMCRKNFEYEEMASKFVGELELIELSTRELISQNLSLQSELMRKDELSKGLSFDLCLLQESASTAKNQRDRLEASLESFEDEFMEKERQLEEAITCRELLEALLQQKVDRIAALELELSEKNIAVELVSNESVELRNTIQEELGEKFKVTARLEEELIEMSNLLGQRNQLIEDLKNDISIIADERDCLNSKVHILKQQMEMAQALAEEHEAIATEAHMIAEERKVYAADKEEENKLLERSVQELDCTVNALESEVVLVRGEAERQRLQREELEMQLEAIRHQMLTLPSGVNIWGVTEERDIDSARQLKEKITELTEAQQSIEALQKIVAEKNAEIGQCKAHLLEVNMHAEVQAREYKKKFKELEAMMQQGKFDTISNTISQTATKSEKCAVKSKGSGSPFKCIGLGVAQQINCEKDQELASARRHIEELEALASSRQKEIFMLNTRLAAAESMTHDVIRDLLGVKADMTGYAATLDRQQVQISERSQIDNEDCEAKDQLVVRLKGKLIEFINERESWLDEINRRQREALAAQFELVKLQQREQSLTTEIEILEVDNARYKKAVMRLEDEVKELHDQQNLHHRIHHHAKIKEENKILRTQIEDLHAKLERSETIFSRVKEELAQYRAASGKKPFVNIDEEEQLRTKLNDSEEERIQQTQKLLALCTYILKVTGLSKLSSAINPSAAENAVRKLKEQNNSLEIEVQDLKVKCKLFAEKIGLLETKQQLF